MAYDASELHRILSTLKETKLTLTFKLNLLRSATASSPTHLATFDNLVDRLVDAGSEVWNLEEGIKEREASLFIEDDEEVRSALKKAMALVGTMDSLVEEVMRLKIVLEGVQSGGAVGGQSKVKDTTVAASEGAVTGDVQKATKAPAPLLMGRWPLPVVASAQISLDQRSVSQANFERVEETVGYRKHLAVSHSADKTLAASVHVDTVASGTMNNTPAAKKQKLNPAPRAPSLTPAANPAKVKGEPGIPKQAKVSHWAPEGYYYVKAHFRRKPKRRAKREEDEPEAKEDQPVAEPPVSLDIVDLDGV